MNRKVAGGFSALLILVGVCGFVLRQGPTSSAVPYNNFHIGFGLLGLALYFGRSRSMVRAFNVGFGVIDLYQAVASWLGLFPAVYFRWTHVDDVLHVVIGLMLTAVGLFFD